VKPKEIRRRASQDLQAEVKRLASEVFMRRFKSHSEEKADRGFVRRSRRDVARILTILNERERAAAAGSATTAVAAPPAAKPASKAGRGRGKKE
jgi:large subunit ribosomal protein L29